MFISHTADLYGAERSLLDLLKRIDRNKYVPLVLFPTDGPLKDKVSSIDCETVVFDMPWWVVKGRKSRSHLIKLLLGMPAKVRYIRDLIRKEDISFVYTNTIVCIDGAIAAKLEGIPHIWHIHEIISATNNLKPYVPRFMMPVVVGILSDKLIVPSKAAKKAIEWYFSEKKVRMIYNGVEIEKFARANSYHHANNFREELEIGQNIKIVALIGLFLEIKGQADLVEAARIICDNYRDVVFVFAGNGTTPSTPYQRLVKKRISDLGLREKVYFVDFRDDIEVVMNAIDILVSASWVESFSKVVCEAMAAGKPVVATKCGGPEEVVVDGKTGYLVPVANPKEMARAIKHLIENEDIAMEMGQRGCERIQKIFSIDQYVKNVERVFAEIG